MEYPVEQNTPLVKPPVENQNPASTQISFKWLNIFPIALSILLVIFASFFIGIQVGKKQIPDQQTTIIQPTATPTKLALTPTTTPTLSPSITITPTPTQDSDTSYTTQIIVALKKGVEVNKTINPSLILPPGVDAAQILNYFQLGDLYFALVMQPSANVVLKTPKDFSVNFTGILVSKKGETSWSKLTEIKDIKPDDKNNPYYLWTDSKQLLLSIVDQNGAGSGEGVMKLFAFPYSGGWKLTECFYFGGSYNGNSEGDYFAYSSKLTKQTPKPVAECNKVVVKP